MEQKSPDLIFNLSDHDLDKGETQFLNEGPLTNMNHFKLKVELFQFYRSIKLKYFYDKDNVQVCILTPLARQLLEPKALSVPRSTVPL